MKKLSIYLPFIFSLVFCVIIQSCKTDNDKQAWDKFLQKGKKCSEQYPQYIAACQAQEKVAYDEYLACINDCHFIPCSIAQSDPDYTACVSQHNGAYSSCRGACFNRYREKILEIEKCWKDWDIEFWKCMNNQ